MFTDLYGYALKAKLWSLVLENIDEKLPSHRKAKIQLANLEALTKKFEREFPSDLLLRVPEKKLRKMRGQFKSRVAQKDKLVDKTIRKLIEESVVPDLQNAGVKITAKKIRGAAHEYIIKMNKMANERAEQALRESYDAVAKVLGGSSELR